MKNETGHESHVLIFLNVALTFMGSATDNFSNRFHWGRMRKTHSCVDGWICAQHHGQLQSQEPTVVGICGISKLNDNIRETGIWKMGIACVSVSLSAEYLLSFSMRDKYHFPSCTTMCVCVHIPSYLQKSNYPKVKWEPEPHCSAHHCKMPHHAADTGINLKSSYLMTSLVRLSPRLLASIWGSSPRKDRSRLPTKCILTE